MLEISLIIINIKIIDVEIPDASMMMTDSDCKNEFVVVNSIGIIEIVANVISIVLKRLNIVMYSDT